MASSLSLTPTPWYVDGDTGIIFGIAPHDNGAVRICQLLHNETDPEDSQRCAADAAMLATAPEAAESLRLLSGLVALACLNNAAGKPVDWDRMATVASEAMKTVKRADGDVLPRRGEAYQEGIAMAKPAPTQEEKIAALRANGYIVGARDPRLNTNYAGAFMVVEEGYTDDELPTKDGSNGPWCIVGDDLAALVDTAYDLWR